MLNNIDAKSGKEIGATLDSAALTNDPFFANLKVAANNSNPADKIIGANTYPIMEERNMKNFMSKVCKFLGKADDATESDLSDALDKHIADHEKLKKAAADGDKEAKKAKADLSEMVVLIGLEPTATLEEAKARVAANVGVKFAPKLFWISA